MSNCIVLFFLQSESRPCSRIFESCVCLFGFVVSFGVQWGVAFRFCAVSLFMAADCCFAWMGAVDKIKTQLDR